MSTFPLRQKLVEIALRDVGQLETSRNRGPAIAKFWPSTSYPSGYQNREPYCAAAVCYWVQQWLKIKDVRDALKLTATQADAWRCKSAAAFGWIDWAVKRKILTFGDSPNETLHTGDIMVFDMSHIGIVKSDDKDTVYTIEANTGAAGGRDGDGIFEKQRQRSLARRFIRILP
jgi:hypothetical protein